MAQTYSTAWKFHSCILLYEYSWRTDSGLCAPVRYWSHNISAISSHRSVQSTVLWNYEAVAYFKLWS